MYKSIARNVPCDIIMSRLLSYISLDDVLKYLEIPRECISLLAETEPVNDFKPEAERDVQYHLQKVAFLLRSNEPAKPIDLDCLVINGQVRPIPIIQDGRHRFLASIIRGDDKIACTFSGRSDLFRYLTGESGQRPHS